MRFYKLPLGDVIVIHDEIDLKPGAIRVKKGGGNAGHNGLKSISAHAGNDYVRVRLGIDHPRRQGLLRRQLCVTGLSPNPIANGSCPCWSGRCTRHGQAGGRKRGRFFR